LPPISRRATIKLHSSLVCLFTIFSHRFLLPELSTLTALFKHYERGDAFTDPNIPRLAKEESLQRYRLATAYSAGKTVLDVGCGYGYGSYMLSLNARRVVGIDEDEEPIRLARSRYTRKNLEFHRAEAIDYLSGSQRYDLVVMFEVIEHVARQDLLLQLVQHALNRGAPFSCLRPTAVTHHSTAAILTTSTNSFQENF
jgi:2-polyprenyl-3-methyl-5-hydroxy-6-metoxy-1,4-benzoquinol methylase